MRFHERERTIDKTVELTKRTDLISSFLLCYTCYKRVPYP